MTPERPLHVVTEDDYFAALQRIANGEHTQDDVNLVRAWEQRQTQDRQAIHDAIRRTIAAMEPAKPIV